ncbi:uncharacterized protein FA14DRAFT_159244 [Meira miltonrushii]|uniref:Protein PBN1 n=1 Tax=Meira miltonrushii TaxID=1280837 RepID=A0A316VHI4_9BASI|nr:uncharacterized protein FA14DRAFT_159244 [Meira miltonrushii]PWN37006.1 hypothetical protein FA14DRAFT_159244 [Meira miltonrushii]
MEASSSSTPVAFKVQLDDAQTAHPRLHISLPASFLDSPQTQSHKCEPNLLIRLPPGLFVDPFTFPTSKKSPSRRIEQHSQVQIDDDTTDDPSSSQRKHPPHAILQDREVVKSIQLLNASRKHGELLNHDFTKVELEKGIGYTISARDRQNLDSEDSNLLIREYTAFVISLHRTKVPTIVKHEQMSTGSEGQIDVEPKGQQIDIDVPLHTRYPIPLGTPLTDLKALTQFDWQKFGESVLWPGEGTYHTALLEYPQAFWQCKGEGMLAVDSGVYESRSETELLAPMHDHLTLPFSQSNHLFVLLPPFRTSREPFRIQIPAGRAELTIATQMVTTISLLLAAVLIIIQTTTLSRKVRRSES